MRRLNNQHATVLFNLSVLKLSVLNLVKCAENDHLFVFSTKCAVSKIMTCNCVSKFTTHANIPNLTIREVEELGPS